jgi:hypothetical protein
MAGTCSNNNGNKWMKYDTVSINMQTLNIYESCINKNEINNSVAFSQNNFNDYSLYLRIGRLKLVCEIIIETGELTRRRFLFWNRKYPHLGWISKIKHLRTALQIICVLWITFCKGKETKQFKKTCISKTLRFRNLSSVSIESIKIPKLRSLNA